MQQKSENRRQVKRIRKIKYLILFLILLFFSLDLYLFGKIVFFKKQLYLSPISGTSKNSSFENRLKKSGIDFLSLKDQGNLYTFDVKGEGNVIITKDKNIDQQISSLQLILHNLKIKGIRFKSLDFRYDKPVIIQYE